MALEGAIFIAGRIFIIIPWNVEAEMMRNKISTIPVWIKMSNVPKELWTKNGLSFLASLIAKPMCIDDATVKKLRLLFARVCVEIPLLFHYPKSVSIEVGEREISIGVEYPWKPSSCSTCMKFGHSTNKCNNIVVNTWTSRRNVNSQSSDAGAQQTTTRIGHLPTQVVVQTITENVTAVPNSPLEESLPIVCVGPSIVRTKNPPQYLVLKGMEQWLKSLMLVDMILELILPLDFN
ncbi:hypothetical protein IFM89_025981 [Coptis chinensis]|uniref:DUF4283 domain-containing protein n=1 Tax=Coptis chinensis TaxID=261450 RepID=A0A835I812_9MAGN|nr:hypothetical protein IFM89_025981 [Coptis chinensis]